MALSSTFFLEAAFARQCALLVPWQPLKNHLYLLSPTELLERH
jgi:hypothetical protein